MRINFYEAMLTDGGRTTLVKDKAVNYEADNLRTPLDIVLMMQRLVHMGEIAEERCYMVALNSICRVLGVFFLSKGTVNESLLSPRELFMRALLAGAVQVILCHNHPSGDVTPSEADIRVTKKIEDVGEMLGIRLADHIIIGSNSYLSFKEAGLLGKEEKKHEVV